MVKSNIFLLHYFVKKAQRRRGKKALADSIRLKKFSLSCMSGGYTEDSEHNSSWTIAEFTFQVSGSTTLGITDDPIFKIAV